MLNCIDTHKKQQIQKKNFFFSFVHSLALGLRKITLMTVNNYGSIFVKIDRNVLMLNEFFALTLCLCCLCFWYEEKYEMNLMCWKFDQNTSIIWNKVHIYMSPCGDSWRQVFRDSWFYSEARKSHFRDEVAIPLHRMVVKIRGITVKVLEYSPTTTELLIYFNTL
jgi:hypothetical protein